MKNNIDNIFNDGIKKNSDFPSSFGWDKEESWNKLNSKINNTHKQSTMAEINENLIRNVFNEMVNIKPSVKKSLYFDDEDEDEDLDFDYRDLGDVIIKQFPWPIGIELRRLFAEDRPNQARLEQIFKTIERTSQLLSFIMISNLIYEINNENLQPSEGIKNEFIKRFSVLSLGNFAWIIRTIGKLFNDQKIDFYMPEMNQCMNKQFFAMIDFWTSDRNAKAHYKTNLTDELIEERCIEYEAKLSELFSSLAFLIKYRFVSVQDIKVSKSKSRDASFQHTLSLLNITESGKQREKKLEKDEYTENNAILVLKTIKDLDSYLNLSPLVIDTRTEIRDTPEKLALKKDIFMYTKYVERKNEIQYLGTEVSEECDLTRLSNYDDLLADFHQMINVFTEN